MPISWLRLIAATLGMAAVTLTHAQSSATLDLPRQPLVSSLSELASQTQSNILFDRAQLGRLLARPLNATLTVDAALTRLLRGTGFTYERIDARTVVIIAQAAPAQELAKAHHSREVDRATLQDRLAEVVVTAERRSEDVQDIPGQVETISGDGMLRSGTLTVFDLGKVLPGVNVTNIGGTPLLSIRGIQQALPGVTEQDPNAVYLNGAYLAIADAIVGQFFDVQRMEVLEGPQGTLYGDNAVGGAINIITNQPGNRFGGTAVVEVGDYRLLHTEVALDLPISDRLLTRLAVNHYSHAGYFANNLDDAGQNAARATLQWNPDAHQQLRLILDDEAVNDLGDPTLEVLVPGGTPTVPVTPKWNNDAIYGSNPPIYYRSSDRGATLAYTRQFSASTLTVLSTVRQFVQHSVQPGSAQVGAGNVPFTNSTRNIHNFNQQTLEVRLASVRAHPVQWLLGTYARAFADNGGLAGYSGYGAVNTSWAAPGNPTMSFYNRDVTRGYALYAQATWTPQRASRLHATVGLRGSYDLTTDTNATNGSLAIPRPLNTLSDDWQALTWRGQVSYDVADRSMMYLTVSRGYEPGGFAWAPPGVGTPEYKAEYASSYESGIKSQLFDQRLQANLNLYRTDYSNQHYVYAYSVFAPSGSLLGVEGGLSNYRSMTYRGGSLDLTALLTADDQLDLRGQFSEQISGGAYLHQINAQLQDLPPGQRVADIPPWSVSATYLRRIALSWGTFLPQLNMNYWHWLPTITRLNEGTGNESVIYTPNPDVTRWDFNLGYEPAHGRWSLSAYVQNILNTYDAAFAVSATGSGGPRAYTEAGPTSPAYVTMTPMPPRTFGLLWAMKF